MRREEYRAPYVMLLLKTYDLNCIMGNIRKIHIEGHPTLLELTFQKSQGHGSQGNTKKPFQTQGDE